ncbi:MAG: sulfatase-like hydrolase/transferase [Spirochaetota bacterium]
MKIASRPFTFFLFFLPLVFFSLLLSSNLLWGKEIVWDVPLNREILFYSYAFFLLAYQSLFPKDPKKLLYFGFVLWCFWLPCQFASEIIYALFRVALTTDLILYFLQNMNTLVPEAGNVLAQVPFAFFLRYLLCSVLYGFCIFALLPQNKQRSYLLNAQKSNFYLEFLILLLCYFTIPFSKTPKYTSNTLHPRIPPFPKRSAINFHLAKNLNVLVFVLEGVSHAAWQHTAGSFAEDWSEVKYCFVPIPHSSNSIFSLLTGRVSNWRKSPNFESIASNHTFPFSYQSKNYQVRFLFSGKKSFENLGGMLAHFAIPMYDKTYIEKNIRQDYKSFLWGLDDRSLFDLHSFFLTKQTTPFLHFFYFSNTHSPYFNPNPQQYKRWDNAIGKERYWNTIDYDISLIAKIIRHTEKKFPKKNIYLVVSDHGESFGEHGFYKHSFSLFNQEIRVPCLFRFPGQKRKSIHAASILDIFPSLLAAQGIPISFPIEGKSFFATSYRLQLDLHSWRSGEFSGEVTNTYKTIRNVKTKRIWKMDLDDRPIKY